MILTGSEILKEVNNKKIKIEPFNENSLTTNSYDLRLGHKLLKYINKVIDPKKENEYELFDIPMEGFLMEKGTFLLGETFESFGSDNYVPIIHGKSGIARLGLFIHITSDLFDIGTFGKSTLQLYSTLPIKLYPGMSIAQVSFWSVQGKIELYNGKYQNQMGPTPSKIHKDFSL